MNHKTRNSSPSSAAQPLLIAMGITASFTVIELLGGFLSGSLALMSDAGHMFTDTLALALSLAALRVALRPATEQKTYGFLRAEILAAWVNGATLIVISVLVFYEAIRRALKPPEVDAPLMLLVASLGLAANAGGVYLLRDRTRRRSLNVRGAFLHMLGDLLSSFAVIIGALLILTLNLKIADPLLSIVIGALILYGAWKLVTQSTTILLEAVPSHLKLEDVRSDLLGIEGVADVHDLHVWTLSTGLHALSAHLVVADKKVSECSGLVDQSAEMLKERFAISHTTFQLECKSCGEEVCVFRQDGH